MTVVPAVNLLPSFRAGPSVTLLRFDMILVDSVTKHFSSNPQKLCRFFLVPVGFHQLTDNPLSLKIGNHLHQLDLSALSRLFPSLL